MPTLHIRNVPPEVYEWLRGRAETSGRSMNTDVIELIQEGLERYEANERMMARLDAMAAGTRLRPGAPAPEDIIRRDRDSR